MINIGIIGAGQLGSRHLQACSSLTPAANIYVIDPNATSLKIAEERWESMNPSDIHKTHFVNSLKEANVNYDVVIVATNSIIRSSVIKELLSHTKVKCLILEKFLFTKLEEYDEVSKLIKINNTSTWVNCPRRMFSFYKKLKSIISTPIDMVVSGNNWGLGSNAIHFIDIFSYLCNAKNVAVNVDELNNEVYESKRPGYLEFNGTMKIKNGENKLTIHCLEGELLLPEITINTPTQKFIIKESGSPSMKTMIKPNDALWIEESITVPFQSQLTNIIIEDLITKGTCDLTPYEESSLLHISLLSKLIDKLRLIKKDTTIDQCQIT